MNRAPNGRMAYGDNPVVDNCRCKKSPKEDAKGNWNYPFGPLCYYRGPAFEESEGRNFGGSELLQMYELEKNLQGWHPGARNEVILDSGSVDMMMSRDPGATITALVLNDRSHDSRRPNMTALDQVLELQSLFKSKYNVEIPIVRVNVPGHVTRKQGPFSEYVPGSLDLMASN